VGVERAFIDLFKKTQKQTIKIVWLPLKAVKAAP